MVAKLIFQHTDTIDTAHPIAFKKQNTLLYCGYSLQTCHMDPDPELVG